MEKNDKMDIRSFNNKSFVNEQSYIIEKIDDNTFVAKHDLYGDINFERKRLGYFDPDLIISLHLISTFSNLGIIDFSVGVDIIEKMFQYNLNLQSYFELVKSDDMNAHIDKIIKRLNREKTNQNLHDKQESIEPDKKGSIEPDKKEEYNMLVISLYLIVLMENIGIAEPEVSIPIIENLCNYELDETKFMKIMTSDEMNIYLEKIKKNTTRMIGDQDTINQDTIFQDTINQINMCHDVNKSECTNISDN